MNRMNRLTTWITAGVVATVGAFAAIASYQHNYDLGIRNAQWGTAGRLWPLAVDLLILAVSLVMMFAASHDIPIPKRIRFFLYLGIGATIPGNVGYGIIYGWLAALISGWPAVAFIGAAESFVWLIHIIADMKAEKARPIKTTKLTSPAKPKPAIEPKPIKSESRQTSEPIVQYDRDPMELYADQLVIGQWPGVKQIEDDYHIGQKKATVIRDRLRARVQSRSNEMTTV